jgi:hypothetical protein
VSADTPADVLHRAADRVQFQGWTQGMLARNEAEVGVSPWDPKAITWCALGAFYADAGYWNLRDHYREAYCALSRYVGNIVTFNNAPGRTAGEVADAMRRCAKELENA